jgi:hypothetical protein
VSEREKERRAKQRAESLAQNACTDVLWGVPAIATAINRSVRSTYHALECGHIPCAKKLGGMWCLRLRDFHALFDSAAA